MENAKIEIGQIDSGLGVQVEAIYKGLEGIFSQKTTVGDPIKIDDMTIIPINEVSAGLATGAFGENAKKNGAGAVAFKVNPVALFIIQNGNTKLVNIKNQDPLTKLIDVISEHYPEAVDKVKKTGVSAKDQIKAKTYVDAGSKKEKKKK
ncbi:MAG: GerW family sporulation protein [Eubacteriales bacterium]|nr:GerW family sporulation protein [Eubacteriales bacterium]